MVCPISPGVSPQTSLSRTPCRRPRGSPPPSVPFAAPHDDHYHCSLTQCAAFHRYQTTYFSQELDEAALAISFIDEETFIDEAEPIAQGHRVGQGKAISI